MAGDTFRRQVPEKLRSLADSKRRIHPAKPRAVASGARSFLTLYIATSRELISAALGESNYPVTAIKVRRRINTVGSP